jgi:lipopolysaccharide export system permease protein
MIRRTDRYLGRAALMGTLAVWVSLTTLFMLFNLLDELKPSGETIRLADVMWYVFLTGPRAAYMVYPVSALIGALIGIGGLAAANEVVALRTAGLSRLRISAAVLGAIGLLTLGVMAMGEWIAPAAEAQARAFKYARAYGDSLAGGTRGVWIRDGSQFVLIERPLVSAGADGENLVFRNVVIYDFDDAGALRDVTRAESARHDGETWRLEQVQRTAIGATAIDRRVSEEQIWGSTIKPELLDTAILRPRYMSIRALREQLAYLGQNALDDRVYRSAFWTKALFPLTVLALVLAGMPFVFGASRQHGKGVRLFIGMSLGGLFMIVSRAMQNLSDAYGLPSLLGAGLPSVLLAVTVVLVLRRSV